MPYTRRTTLKAMAGAALLPAVAHAAESAASPGEVQGMETIKQRLREEALAGRAPAGEADGFRRSLRPDGTWADVDYADKTGSSWRTPEHLRRVLVMAHAYRRPGPQQGSPALKQAILAGLDHWLAKDYQNPNWWHNQIGTPLLMVPILLLMEQDLSPEELRAGLKIVERAKLGMTGQNLLWVADLSIRRGCLAGDALLVKEAFARISGEIVVTEREGIQADYSFHQHGAQLYSGGYGLGFSQDAPRLAALAQGTPFQLAQEKDDILAAYLVEGQQWFVRGRTFDYSAVGRELARRGHSAGRLSQAAQTMAALCPARKADLQQMARRLATPETQLAGAAPANTAALALSGNRHFWRSDIMVHRRAGFSTSVRMASTRMQRTEMINGENLKGYHLADGVHYLYLTGDEYRDIFPVWDWEKLPGITCEIGAAPVRPAHGVTAFVGGVSDGANGLAAYDFAMGALKARKAWFFVDDRILCLGAGITCPTEHLVVTTVNQCLSQAPAAIGSGGETHGWANGLGWFDSPGWAWHDGVAYYFPLPGRVRIRREAQTGSWREINAAASGDPVSMTVFSLWLEHGPQPAGGSYCYVVAPGVSQADAPAGAKALPAVLSNTPDLQAARHAGLKLTQAAFYAPGRLAAGAGPSLAVDAPCLVMLRETAAGVELSVSNPESKPLAVNVSIGRRLAGEGCAWDAAAGATRVSVQLPDGPPAGKSVLRRLAAAK